MLFYTILDYWITFVVVILGATSVKLPVIVYQVMALLFVLSVRLIPFCSWHLRKRWPTMACLGCLLAVLVARLTLFPFRRSDTSWNYGIARPSYLQPLMSTAKLPYYTQGNAAACGRTRL